MEMPKDTDNITNLPILAGLSRDWSKTHNHLQLGWSFDLSTKYVAAYPAWGCGVASGPTSSAVPHIEARLGAREEEVEWSCPSEKFSVAENKYESLTR